VSAENIYIRALTPDDWQDLRTIRIRAVKKHTNVFLADPKDTEDKPKEHWQDVSGDKQVFGLFDDQTLIGITGVFTWREDPDGHTGIMAMSYIEPAYRGKGYSALLYKARIDFSLEYKPWVKLRVSHRAGNEASRRAMIKHGFKLIGQKEINWPDGTRDLEYQYELDLKALRTAS